MDNLPQDLLQATPSPSRSYQLRGQAAAAIEEDESLVLAAGDTCTAASIVTVRGGQAITTDVIATLRVGTVLEVLEMGRDRRAKVAAGNIVGWVSVRTKRNEPLVLKCRSTIARPEECFQKGGRHSLKAVVTVRSGEDLDTPVVAHLNPGTTVVITEMGTANKRRAKIATDGAEGWITLTTKSGDTLLASTSRPTGSIHHARDSLSDISISMVRTALEAARSGDLDAVSRSINVNCVGGSQVLSKVDVNCGDVRGRTALIYASAFGHGEVVKYFLTSPDIEVNAIDDTLKTALHHAAKKARSQDGVQVQIVQLLIDAKAHVEARDHNGCTALMFASVNGELSVVQALVETRANINIRDFEGHTPLAYASHFHHQEVAQLLVWHGGIGGDSDHNNMEQVVDSSEAHKKKWKTKVSNKRANKTLSLATGVIEGMELGVIAAEEIAVLDQTRNDENAARDRALSKLHAVSQNATSVKELEAAIQEAIEASVEQADIGMAEGRVQKMKAHVKAREELRVSVVDRSVNRLREAIRIAEENGVSAAEVDEGKTVLEVEELKEMARQQLREAQDRGDADSLKAALHKARHAQLKEAELAPVEELLRGAESKEKAESALRRAIEENKVVGLKFAIQLAREAGVDPAIIGHAEDVLRVEEPKERARALLLEAMQNCNIGNLRSAIAKGREVGLDDAEWSEAQALLEHEELKERMEAEVRVAVEDSNTVDVSNIEALREKKNVITNAIHFAKGAGVPESALLEGEACRRKIHNMIEDLKGSIRVFCRVRPLSTKETSQNDSQITERVDSMTLAVAYGHAVVNFAFDAVFTPGSQEEVFEDCKNLVQSAMDGYNVTIFAFGQTGAGKTFTMYGNSDQEGMAPRTINELFKIMKRDEARFNFTVMASMLELYQSQVVDLLTKNSPATSSVKLNIRVDKGGQIQIEHLVQESVHDTQELLELLQRGKEQRAVAATAMNSESSRSHLILIITIVSVNKETRDQLRGKILLCDLAGSERLKKSESTGDVQKEAIEINKSLTALGDVIEALTKKQKQIPYRNHKLTQLMQDSLGGTAKTLMFVNCSPASSNEEETVMSLKYATRAKRITNAHARDARSSCSSPSGSLNPSRSALPLV